MPWKDKDRMTLKLEFLKEFLEKKVNISTLCIDFGISRKTAYKWIKRYKESGLQGLENLSRRPMRYSKATSMQTIALILKTRKSLHWGARKLRQYLRNQGMQNLPCEATFNRILIRHNCIKEEESQKREHFIRFERQQPNELWQMDFKGFFGLPKNEKCYPLTILDDYSRFSICIKACSNPDEKSVKQELESAFRTYGLPEGMTMDNGAPWGSGRRHLTKLTVWLMRLNIQVSHSAPAHPQTQGKLERFHRSFKEEVLKYHQFKDIQDAQHKFNEWRELYNNHRPHEGIGLMRPQDRYLPSSRLFPEKLPEIVYPVNALIKKVSKKGDICFKGIHFFLGEHLTEEYVGLIERQEDIYDIYFCRTNIQKIDLRNLKTRR